jgi:hypothetical protein
MLSHEIRKTIQDITSGNVLEGETDASTAIRNLLCTSFPTSTTVKINFESQQRHKEEQAAVIVNFCQKQGLWIDEITGAKYLTRGGESIVFFASDNKHVLKINDAVYYATWLEFFNSITLHNLIFTNTHYDFLGLTYYQNTLCAVLKQPFIVTNEQAEIAQIKSHLEFNGFYNNKRNDYENKQLGILLEDMHDENVLLKEGVLFFIDTVFYTVKPIVNSE